MNSFIRTILALFSVGLLTCCSNPVAATPSLEVQEASVASVTAGEGYCSGWVLGDRVVTAAHCNETGAMDTVFSVDFGDGKPHAFMIDKIGDKDNITGPDVMFLKPILPIKMPPSLKLCAFDPYYGEQLHLMGGPLGLSQSINFGRVAKPERDLSKETGFNFGKFIQYDGVILPGNSGGPAIDDKTGCVIGMAEMVQPAQPLLPIAYGVPYLTKGSDVAMLGRQGEGNHD